MKWSHIDWGELRTALLVLLSALVIGGAMLATTYSFKEKAKVQFAQEKARFASVRNRYRTLDDEQKTLEQYLPVYRGLQEQGIIGEEQRLNWIETLRGAVAQVKLPSLGWDISSQREYKPEIPLTTGVFELHASDMDLTMGLLHEGDLRALLAHLNRDAVGLFTVSGCELERIGRELREDPTVANINARCTLRWFTIKPPEQAGTGA